jgi:hypothetical protein
MDYKNSNTASIFSYFSESAKFGDLVSVNLATDYNGWVANLVSPTDFPLKSGYDVISF